MTFCLLKAAYSLLLVCGEGKKKKKGKDSSLPCGPPMELFCPLILTPEEKEVLLLTAPMHTPPHTVRLWEVNCINVFPEQKQVL